jgi:hypothetical protein
MAPRDAESQNDHRKHKSRAGRSSDLAASAHDRQCDAVERHVIFIGGA